MSTRRTYLHGVMPWNRPFFGRPESREKEAPVQALDQGQRRDDSGAMRDSCLGLDAGGVKIAA
jgi:hypothetical protein